MKKCFLIIFLWVCAIFAQAQIFEGYIKYAHRVEITDTTLQKNDVFIAYDFGNKSTLYIKGGNYHWQFENCRREYQIYINNTATLYDKYPKNDTLFSSSANLENEVIIEMNTKKSQVSVLGEPCELLTVKSKFIREQQVRGRMFYYSKNYPLHPDFLKNFKMNNNNEIFAKMGYVPLRFVFLYPGFRVTYFALEIKRTKVEDSLFDVSKKKIKPLSIRK
ncbi:MAG: hypothetical protein RMJ97_02970 [Raineya sp.]|nr:hypothetical protein [Raineya sp.]MDW8295824.1 hypothetical protein [Raineya sp.]